MNEQTLCQKTADVLIPAYRPGKELERLLTMLENQSFPISHIYIINTEASFWDDGLQARHPQLFVRHIAKEDFDHAATRRQLAGMSQSDYMIFMTQDAVPADHHLVEELLAPFSDPQVKAAYARQLPKEDCREAERFTRCFNYPEEGRVKTANDLPLLGIKTFFCSDVCAAYEKETYEKLGGFVPQAIFNEDMLYAAKVIRRGYGVAYAAKARVFHSHNYTCRQQFHRNFDLGVSQAQNPDVFRDIPSEGEGIKLVLATARYLASIRRWWLIPSLFAQSACKYAGYLLGKNYRRLPKRFLLMCTDSPGFWRK